METNYYEAQIESVKNAYAFKVYGNEGNETHMMNVNKESVQAFVDAFADKIVSEYYGYEIETDENGCEAVRIFKKRTLKIGTTVFETERIHIETKTFL